MGQSHSPGGQPQVAHNIGALNTGSGGVTVHGNAVGSQTITYVGQPEPADPTLSAPKPRRKADVGVLTVLHEEMRAVVDVLARRPGYRTYQLAGGAQVHEAPFATPGGMVRTVAMQTLDRGPRSAALAYQVLRRQFAPPVVVLVGIAGGIRFDVNIGDVVIADEVVYYDARRESATGAHRRGQSHAVAAVLRHRLNEFFRMYGETVHVSTGGQVRVHRGPIGSGDAVVTDDASDIRRFLAGFNEKTLALETETGGVAQAFYEEIDLDTSLRGWLTIRGVSDHADHTKGVSHHELAARHAAGVLEQVLPVLNLQTSGS